MLTPVFRHADRVLGDSGLAIIRYDARVRPSSSPTSASAFTDMMGVLVQENDVVGSKRRVEARAEHGAHVVRPSRMVRHFRTSRSGYSYVGSDAHAMIVPWPRNTALTRSREGQRFAWRAVG